MSLRNSALAAALAVAGSVSHAQVVNENFNGYTAVFDATTASFGGAWTVSSGTVDILGPSLGVFDFLPGNGNYIDLAGSNFSTATFGRSLSLTAGVPYTLTFSLAGSQRNFTETVNVTFGTTTQQYIVANNAPFSMRTLNFTPTTTGSFSLLFANLAGSTGIQGDLNEGALLDNVVVRAVPEPTVTAMLLAGIASASLIAARRRKAEGRASF